MRREIRWGNIVLYTNWKNGTTQLSKNKLTLVCISLTTAVEAEADGGEQALDVCGSWWDTHWVKIKWEKDVFVFLMNWLPYYSYDPSTVSFTDAWIWSLSFSCSLVIGKATVSRSPQTPVHMRITAHVKYIVRIW